MLTAQRLLHINSTRGLEDEHLAALIYQEMDESQRSLLLQKILLTILPTQYQAEFLTDQELNAYMTTLLLLKILNQFPAIAIDTAFSNIRNRLDVTIDDHSYHNVTMLMQEYTRVLEELLPYLAAENLQFIYNFDKQLAETLFNKFKFKVITPFLPKDMLMFAPEIQDDYRWQAICALKNKSEPTFQALQVEHQKTILFYKYEVNNPHSRYRMSALLDFSPELFSTENVSEICNAALTASLTYNKAEECIAMNSWLNSKQCRLTSELALDLYSQLLEVRDKISKKPDLVDAFLNLRIFLGITGSDDALDISVVLPEKALDVYNLGYPFSTRIEKAIKLQALGYFTPEIIKQHLFTILGYCLESRELRIISRHLLSAWIVEFSEAELIEIFNRLYSATPNQRTQAQLQIIFELLPISVINHVLSTATTENLENGLHADQYSRLLSLIRQNLTIDQVNILHGHINPTFLTLANVADPKFKRILSLVGFLSDKIDPELITEIASNIEVFKKLDELYPARYDHEINKNYQALGVLDNEFEKLFDFATQDYRDHYITENIDKLLKYFDHTVHGLSKTNMICKYFLANRQQIERYADLLFPHLITVVSADRDLQAIRNCDLQKIDIIVKPVRNLLYVTYEYLDAAKKAEVAKLIINRFVCVRQIYTSEYSFYNDLPGFVTPEDRIRLLKCFDIEFEKTTELPAQKMQVLNVGAEQPAEPSKISEYYQPLSDMQLDYLTHLGFGIQAQAYRADTRVQEFIKEKRKYHCVIIKMVFAVLDEQAALTNSALSRNTPGYKHG